MVVESVVGYLQNYDFTFNAKMFEMAMLYLNLLLVCLMIPAKVRLNDYRATHPNKDMAFDFLSGKINDQEAAIGWSFLFIFLMNLHTVMLLVLVFFGQTGNFTVFQLGNMMFFVVYSASDYLYAKTSILMPLFMSFFILAQYLYSLESAYFDLYLPA